MLEQPLEQRVVAVVQDDEPRVDRDRSLLGVDVDGVGVPADPVARLEDVHVMVASSWWAATSPDTPAPTTAMRI